MNYIICIIQLLLLISYADARHTKVFEESYKIQKALFYDGDTFGMDIYDDPKTLIKDNQAFRKTINQRRVCHTELCIDNKFYCGRSGNLNCYHVEHIIDLNGPEYRDCKNCKNSAANRVMAYGVWNHQLGGLARNYYCDSMAEKEIVYGRHRVRAVRNILNSIYLDELPNRAVYVTSDCNGTYIGHNITSNTTSDCVNGQIIVNGVLTNCSYNPICDSLDDCSCDNDALDSVCGCDCDIDNENTDNNSNVNNKDNMLYGIIGTLSVLLALNICIACIFYRKYKIGQRNILSNELLGIL